ncbi:hypothetical protein AK812_SmicGene32205 [Symbiodinium microadriaticum]|uniref:Uncharacterized protein n=1 Tax=Symbiodinium microadriaticum TaxID=2951 RepID=A0A1Q9CUQ7_SYMMI|nr:hypothetical protein AK812_SmicGene32205 [Symbiodinium microadriaticum]
MGIFDAIAGNTSGWISLIANSSDPVPRKDTRGLPFAVSETEDNATIVNALVVEFQQCQRRFYKEEQAGYNQRILDWLSQQPVPCKTMAWTNGYLRRQTKRLLQTKTLAGEEAQLSKSLILAPRTLQYPLFRRRHRKVLTKLREQQTEFLFFFFFFPLFFGIPYKESELSKFDVRTDSTSSWEVVQKGQDLYYRSWKIRGPFTEAPRSGPEVLEQSACEPADSEDDVYAGFPPAFGAARRWSASLRLCDEQISREIRDAIEGNTSGWISLIANSSDPVPRKDTRDRPFVSGDMEEMAFVSELLFRDQFPRDSWKHRDNATIVNALVVEFQQCQRRFYKEEQAGYNQRILDWLSQQPATTGLNFTVTTDISLVWTDIPSREKVQSVCVELRSFGQGFRGQDSSSVWFPIQHGRKILRDHRLSEAEGADSLAN